MDARADLVAWWWWRSCGGAVLDGGGGRGGGAVFAAAVRGGAGEVEDAELLFKAAGCQDLRARL